MKTTMCCQNLLIYTRGYPNIKFSVVRGGARKRLGQYNMVGEGRGIFCYKFKWQGGHQKMTYSWSFGQKDAIIV